MKCVQAKGHPTHLKSSNYVATRLIPSLLLAPSKRSAKVANPESESPGEEQDSLCLATKDQSDQFARRFPEHKHSRTLTRLLYHKPWPTDASLFQATPVRPDHLATLSELHSESFGARICHRAEQPFRVGLRIVDRFSSKSWRPMRCGYVHQLGSRFHLRRIR